MCLSTFLAITFFTTGVVVASGWGYVGQSPVTRTYDLMVSIKVCNMVQINPTENQNN